MEAAIRVNETHIEDAKKQLRLKYEKDLKFFLRLQEYIKHPNNEYFTSKEYGLLEFLKEFRVIRRVTIDIRQPFFQEFLNWSTKNSTKTVIEMVEVFNSKVFQTNEVSLVSKLFFLKTPDKFIPYDKQAKNAVGYGGKNYDEYIKQVEKFENINKSHLEEIETSMKGFFEEIEKEYKAKLEGYGVDVAKVRKMRILDKLLWSVGSEGTEKK